jgi:uncharacterized protein
MPSSALPNLSPDDLDDLIYSTRTGDLAALKEQITSQCTANKCTASTVLHAAIDDDIDSDTQENTGSGCSLLHYPAANGNLEVLEYLLSELGQAPSSTTTEESSSSSKPPLLVNHMNLSGNTALHWACLNGHLGAVKALVNAGADPWIKNSVGRDTVGEAETAGENDVKGAKECVVWMLMNCKGGNEGQMGKEEETDEKVDSKEGEAEQANPNDATGSKTGET